MFSVAYGHNRNITVELVLIVYKFKTNFEEIGIVVDLFYIAFSVHI